MFELNIFASLFSAQLRQRTSRFVDDENGATAIEYSLIAALLFLAIAGSIRAVMSSTDDMYDTISTTMTTEMNNVGSTP